MKLFRDNQLTLLLIISTSPALGQSDLFDEIDMITPTC